MMETHGIWWKLTEHCRTFQKNPVEPNRNPWNTVEHDGTLHNIPEKGHRIRRKVMESNRTWQKVVELSRKSATKGREHGKEVVEYSRTFYGEMYILNSSIDLRDR